MDMVQSQGQYLLKHGLRSLFFLLFLKPRQFFEVHSEFIAIQISLIVQLITKLHFSIKLDNEIFFDTYQQTLHYLAIYKTELISEYKYMYQPIDCYTKSRFT